MDDRQNETEIESDREKGRGRDGCRVRERDGE